MVQLPLRNLTSKSEIAQNDMWKIRCDERQKRFILLWQLKRGVKSSHLSFLLSVLKTETLQSCFHQKSRSSPLQGGWVQVSSGILCVMCSEISHTPTQEEPSGGALHWEYSIKTKAAGRDLFSEMPGCNTNTTTSLGLSSCSSAGSCGVLVADLFPARV